MTLSLSVKSNRILWLYTVAGMLLQDEAMTLQSVREGNDPGDWGGQKTKDIWKLIPRRLWPESLRNVVHCPVGGMPRIGLGGLMHFLPIWSLYFQGWRCILKNNWKRRFSHPPYSSGHPSAPWVASTLSQAFGPDILVLATRRARVKGTEDKETCSQGSGLTKGWWWVKLQQWLWE